MRQNTLRRVARDIVAALAPVVIGAVVLAAPLPSIASAAPAPAAPDDAPARPGRRPTTQYDLYADVLAFNRRTLAGAYEESGRRDPKWDKPAMEFLEAVARYFSASRVHEFYHPAGEPPKREGLVAMGDAAVAAGCDDPLVVYCLGAILSDVPDTKAARPLFLRAEESMRNGDYPINRRYAAAHRVEVIAGHADAEAAARAADLRVKLFAGKLDDVTRRIHFHLAWNDVVAMGRGVQLDFVAAMDADEALDPWARDLAAGLLHIDLAWDRRGGAFADAVTERQWRGFRENLATARDRLVKAWKQAPHLPEAAEAMITLAMGGGEELGEEELDWFVRAQAAQVDSAEAYGRMRLSLKPRWGGSYEQMLELGDACVEVGRYDTMIPWEYVATLSDIRKDAGGTWTDLLTDEEIYAGVVRVAKGYAAARKGTSRADWFTTFHAAAAWQSGRYDDARKVLDALGPKADPTAFAAVGEPDGRLAIADAYAKSGPHGVEIAAAEALLDDGDAAGAAAKFKALRPKVAGDPAAVFVESKLRVADWQLRLDSGEWIDVQPVDTLAGWEVAAGKWKVEGDAVVCTSDPTGETRDHQRMLAFVAGDLGDAPFELTGRVEFTVERGRGREAGNCGFAVKSPSTRYTAFVLFDRDDQSWFLSYYALKRTYHPAEVGASTDFVFRRGEDGALSVDLNGKPVAESVSLPERQFAAPLQFGVGGLSRGPVQFKNLRIRKILPGGAPGAAPKTDRPAPAGTDRSASEKAAAPF